MMHDADDATLMQALWDADPLSRTVLDDRARRRLEHSWRQAADQRATGGATPRRSSGARGRLLQPVAAAIMAVVILASGVMVANVIARRGDGPASITQQKDAGGVEGSYRAIQQDGEDVLVPPVTFLVAGGRALLRLGGSMLDTSPGATWRGFGEVTSMRVDQQMLDGDEIYLRIHANEEQPRWYRYSGSRALWPSGLAETPQPVFEEGTRGFERVDDEDAQAEGLTRYTADVDAADLDFLGWFGPTNDVFGPPVTKVDLWVDADGRVRRLKEMRRAVPEMPTITRFDRFDAVEPIDPPYPEGADAPVAEDIAGMMMYAYGDPTFADELRERVTAELEGDADIAVFEIFERSAAEQREYGPDIDHQLFVVGLRFTDDIVADLDVQRRKLDRLVRISAGDLPANLSPEDGQPHGLDPQGYAALYAPGLVSWMTLDG